MTNTYTSPAPLTAPLVTSAHAVLNWAPSVVVDGTPVLSGELLTFESTGLSWTAGIVEGVVATSYDIYRSEDGGSFSLLDTVTDLTFEDDGLDLETVTYEYYVIGRVGGDETDQSNHVTFGDEGGGGIKVLYDVRDVPSWPVNGIVVAIDVDPVNNRLFFMAEDRTASVYFDHVKVFDILPNGDLDEVYGETITLLANETGGMYVAFRSYFTIIYSGSGKVRIPRYTGMASYNYDEDTGALSLSSNYNDLDAHYTLGQYGLQNGTVMSPSGVTYYVSSAGRNSFLQAVPIPDGMDQSPPINTARETYYNWVSKLNEDIFYVADSSGHNLTRNSINSSGVITQLATHATGMATSGSDDGDHVHNNVFQGHVYAQQTASAQIPPLQPTRRWPITNPTTGALGLPEDGTWDFRGSYPYLLSMNNPGQRSALVHNGHTYFIRRADGNLFQLSRT